MKKIFKIRYALLFVLILFIISLSTPNGILFIFKLKKEISEIKKEITELQLANENYKERIKHLKTNSRIFEIYARTKLGMVKSDEVVYEIND